MTNTLFTFIMLINTVFKLLLCKCIIIYLDNFIVFSKTKKEYKDHLHQVFDILKRNQLYAKPSKWKFYENILTFFGHIISSEGIKPNLEKTKSISELEKPIDVAGLKSFQGLVAFVCKFIPNCSKLITPLAALLKKNVTFKWDYECKKNFLELKKHLIEAPLL